LLRWHQINIVSMLYYESGMESEFTDEFEEWWYTLSEFEQGKVDARVGLLMERGPNLGFPFSSQVKTSRFPEMRELRAQAGAIRCGCCTHLIRAGPRFFWLPVTKTGTTGGPKRTSPWRTGYSNAT
jgi:hypothetical protein